MFFYYLLRCDCVCCSVFYTFLIYGYFPLTWSQGARIREVVGVIMVTRDKFNQYTTRDRGQWKVVVYFDRAEANRTIQF